MNIVNMIMIHIFVMYLWSPSYLLYLLFVIFHYLLFLLTLEICICKMRCLSTCFLRSVLASDIASSVLAYIYLHLASLLSYFLYLLGYQHHILPLLWLYSPAFIPLFSPILLFPHQDYKFIDRALGPCAATLLYTYRYLLGP